MSGQPGEVLAADGKEGLIVAAGKNAVRVRQLQVPGGKPMDARDYLRGHAMAAGTMLQEDTENAIPSLLHAAFAKLIAVSDALK